MSERAVRDDSVLPAYAVRVSDRARHVRLIVNARDGLVVVIPRGWRGDPAAVVASKLPWAMRALAAVGPERALHMAGPAALLPNEVDFRLTGRTFAVAYAPPSGSPARAIGAAGSVRVFGDGDPAARLRALSRWLDREAHATLVPMAETAAVRHGFSPARIRVMRARSRWGSCSARGTVALGRSLMFLPAHLGEAVILHELAHLKVLDHSARFWAELERLDPQARAHRAELRGATSYVPAWVEAR